jgi:hypothetical protein
VIDPMPVNDWVTNFLVAEREDREKIEIEIEK